MATAWCVGLVRCYMAAAIYCHMASGVWQATARVLDQFVEIGRLFGPLVRP